MVAQIRFSKQIPGHCNNDRTLYMRGGEKNEVK